MRSSQSNVTTPGTYSVIDLDKGLRSPEFQIDDRVYRNVLKHAVRIYFYQRAGFKKTAETAGSDWTDAASHMGPDRILKPPRGRRGAD
jgi:endoglucanase